MAHLGLHGLWPSHIQYEHIIWELLLPVIAFNVTHIPMPVAYFPSGQWLPQAAKHHFSLALTVLQTQKTQEPQGPFSREPRLAGFRLLLLTEKNLWSQVAPVFH